MLTLDNCSRAARAAELAAMASAWSMLEAQRGWRGQVASVGSTSAGRLRAMRRAVDLRHGSGFALEGEPSCPIDDWEVEVGLAPRTVLPDRTLGFTA
jgi:hypothetical protein